MKCPACNHTMKHHLQSGRCRRGCGCDLAALKAEFKRKRDDVADVHRKIAADAILTPAEARSRVV